MRRGEPDAIAVRVAGQVDLFAKHLARPGGIDRRNRGGDFLRIAREKGDIGAMRRKNLERGEPEPVPQAKAMLDKLTAQNRFALIFRLGAIKTDAGRKKKIADLVAMLKRGETFYPQKAK